MRKTKALVLAPNLLNVLVKNIDIVLHKKGSNRSELARKLFVTPQSVSKTLSGISAPGLDKVEQIADALNVPAHKLLDPAYGSIEAPGEGLEAAVERALARVLKSQAAAPPPSPRPDAQTNLAKVQALVAGLSEQQAEAVLPVVQSLVSRKSKRHSETG